MLIDQRGGVRVDTDQGSTETLTDPLAGDVRLPGAFGVAWPAVLAFHDLLATEGPIRGLIGPRETARLWERHLLNSAGVVPLLEGASSVIDLGSGAGLPGIVLAAMCPATHVTLLEPMARRVAWLEHVVDVLGLLNTTVTRGRAEDVGGTLTADVVTARAVAPLDKLYRWAAPLVRPGGRLLALKGTRAAEEIEAARGVAQETGWAEAATMSSALFDGIEPTTVVRAVKNHGTRRVR